MDELPANLFQRQDESDDALFYKAPRLVTHIDDATIAALTEFYREFLQPQQDLLDLMSSWISHLPEDMPFGRVAGLGMNAAELAENPRLSDFRVHDLNTEPTLPYDAAVFDRAMVVVSVQYLTQPFAVFSDVPRVLRPGGRLAIAMSHRCFPTKAIAAFHHLAPTERIQLVATYLDKAGFIDVDFIDRSPPRADPLWLLVGTNPPNE